MSSEPGGQAREVHSPYSVSSQSLPSSHEALGIRRGLVWGQRAGGGGQPGPPSPQLPLLLSPSPQPRLGCSLFTQVTWTGSGRGFYSSQAWPEAPLCPIGSTSLSTRRLLGRLKPPVHPHHCRSLSGGRTLFPVGVEAWIPFGGTVLRQQPSSKTRACSHPQRGPVRETLRDPDTLAHFLPPLWSGPGSYLNQGHAEAGVRGMLAE